MADSVDNKAMARAWLYELLARLELCTDVVGEKREPAIQHIIIDLRFLN